MTFCCPRLIPSTREEEFLDFFVSERVRGIDVLRNEQVLHDLLSLLLLRRTLKSAGTELPPLKELVVHTGFTDLQVET